MGILQGPPQPQPIFTTCAACPHKHLCAVHSRCAAESMQEPIDAHSACDQCELVEQCFVRGRCLRLEPLPVITPPVRQAASWEVYGTIGAGLSGAPPRVKHKGQELEGITAVKVETTSTTTKLTIEVQLPADAYVRMKGAAYDWRDKGR